ncbi:DUF1016 N-terminal domain-containing protein [Segatella bryantii]|uniref:DUF1016 N-terminal domain-containing protein n=1 Tax=Segatella bryantii TaxID=77095 RepID=UPI0035A37ED1
MTAISPTASEKSSQISPTASDKFITPGVELVSKLSFSHIVEILTVDDPLARFFYETECIRCCWNVKELRRQISTNLYFRAGVSQNPQLLIDRTEKNSLPALTIRDPLSSHAVCNPFSRFSDCLDSVATIIMVIIAKCFTYSFFRIELKSSIFMP